MKFARKLLATLLAALTLTAGLTFFGTASLAADETQFTYSVIDGAEGYIRITGVKNGAKAVTLPASCDGYIVTEVVLPNKGLTSCSTAACEGLTYLDVSGNSLTALDLAKNERLVWLSCAKNKLTSLVLPKANSRLARLDASSNSLKSVTLTGISQLEQVNLAGNRLTSLAVTGLTKLRRLDVQNNYLANDGKIAGLDKTALANAHSKDCQVNGNHSEYHGFFFGTQHPASLAGFDDIAPGSWYFGDVQYCVEKGLFAGTSATSFSPDGTMTRAMLVTVLHRLAGTPAVSGGSPFTDVAGSAWYTNAVKWAVANGITGGVSSSKFDPDGAVTREQAAVFLCRYAEKYAPAMKNTAALTFADTAKISSWAAPAVKWCRAYGIMNGTDSNRFDPQGSATRAQVAAIVHRFAGVAGV
jgi:hypothetical protein